MMGTCTHSYGYVRVRKGSTCVKLHADTHTHTDWTQKYVELKQRVPARFPITIINRKGVVRRNCRIKALDNPDGIYL